VSFSVAVAESSQLKLNSGPAPAMLQSTGTLQEMTASTDGGAPAAGELGRDSVMPLT
jgi:hypothetical protein